MTTQEIQGAQPAHTPGPWESYTDCPGQCCWLVRQVGTEDEPGQGVTWPETSEANACLIAAAPELLAACINARDMLATDRQAFVDCQQLRDSRTDDPIAHGLVAVEDGVWLDADDAEALRDYDRAIELIDKATAKATGTQA